MVFSSIRYYYSKYGTEQGILGINSVVDEYFKFTDLYQSVW